MTPHDDSRRRDEMAAYLLGVARAVGVPENREVEVLAAVIEMVEDLGADVREPEIHDALRALVVGSACGTEKDLAEAMARLRAAMPWREWGTA